MNTETHAYVAENTDQLRPKLRTRSDNVPNWTEVKATIKIHGQVLLKCNRPSKLSIAKDKELRL